MIRWILLLSVTMLIAGGENLAGRWTLARSERGGQKFQDPRWTCSLDFDSNGNFSMESTTVQEIFLQSADGKHTARARQTTVFVRGQFTVEKGALRLVLAPDSDLNFATLHFGPPHNGSYLVEFQSQGELRLTGPSSTLVFQRHEKRS